MMGSSDVKGAKLFTRKAHKTLLEQDCAKRKRGVFQRKLYCVRLIVYLGKAKPESAIFTQAKSVDRKIQI